jgi:hypothetical protein
MAEELGLQRLTPQARAALGPTGGLHQVRKSIACLRLLRRRPDLAARLKRTNPEAWQRLVDLRLAIAQARNALDPTVKAATRGELLLLSQITDANDAIEDHLIAWMERPGATDTERLRLRAKFDDPAGIRDSYEVFLQARKERRGRRKALHAAALAEARTRVEKARTADRLTRTAKEDRP